MLYSSDFEDLKSVQFCSNEKCTEYNLIGAGNIRTHSRSKGQVYCAKCKKRWVVTKGTFLFGIKTPIDKIIKTILMLEAGTGLRKTCRIQGITPNTVNLWIEKASRYVDEFTYYMAKNMKLKKSQINKFWNYIEQRKNIKDQVKN